jgi:hypothetical protein
MQARSSCSAPAVSPRRTLRSPCSLRAPPPPSVFRSVHKAFSPCLLLPPFFAPPLPSLRSSSRGAKNPGPHPTQERFHSPHSQTAGGRTFPPGTPIPRLPLLSCTAMLPPTTQRPWGAKRTTPAQGRVTFKTIVLRCRHGGGLYCPSPSPPGFPLYKDNRRGLLSPLHYVTLRSKTRPSTAQRGRSSPRPVAGDRAEAKNANIRVCVFCCSGRRPAAPASMPPQRVVLCPPGFSTSHHTKRATPHG